MVISHILRFAIAVCPFTSDSSSSKFKKTRDFFSKIFKSNSRTHLWTFCYTFFDFSNVLVCMFQEGDALLLHTRDSDHNMCNGCLHKRCVSHRPDLYSAVTDNGMNSDGSHCDEHKNGFSRSDSEATRHCSGVHEEKKQHIKVQCPSCLPSLPVFRVDYPFFNTSTHLPVF